MSAVSRAMLFSLCLLLSVCLAVQPAAAQAIALIRDTEIERTLKSYADPLLKAAGLDPAAVKLYIINSSDINAFVAEGQNIFVNTGLFMQLQSPNEVIGILAHETGHIAGGHLSRGGDAIAKASIPMLISMAAGIAAMVAGAGDVGMGLLMLGQQVAQGQFNAFSRSQEGTADQMGLKYLNTTKQSGNGMLRVFQKFADDEAMSAYRPEGWARSHPASRDRMAALERSVMASPYFDAKDSPETIHEFRMIKAKLYGYIEQVQSVLYRYPESDVSKPARYARAMAYFRKPDMQKALAEINGLIAEEPDNPYFHEMLGQVYVEMSKPQRGIEPYQRAVDLMPEAPLLRVSLAAAQLATELPQLSNPALENLKVALRHETDNAFAWYQAAQAYSRNNNDAMANLATAERYYAVGAYPSAARFATLAQRKLKAGSTDWQRANDIMAVATLNKSK